MLAGENESMAAPDSSPELASAPPFAETVESMEERVQLWRAQSMQKIEELERMNEALRLTLNLHSCCFGPEPDGNAHPHGGKRLVLSKILEEPTTADSVNGLEGKSQEDDPLEQQKVNLLKIDEVESVELKDDLQNLKKSNDALESMLARAQGEIQNLEAQMREQECLVTSLQADLSQKNERLNFIADEKAVGEEALEACQLECRQLTALVKEIDGNVVRLTTAVTTRTMERDNAICAEKKETEARIQMEGELQKEFSILLSKLDEAEAEKLRLHNEFERLKTSQDEDKTKHAETLETLQKAQKQLEEAQRDVKQLKALVTQLDVTREELVEKLKSTLSDQNMVDNQLGSFEMDLQRLGEELHVRDTEILQLHEVVEALGKERDHLLSQLELHLQKSGQLTAENDTLTKDLLHLKRKVQNTENKVEAGNLQLHQSLAKIESLREQLLTEEESRKALENRCANQADQLRVIAEDCAKKGLEQQLIKKEFQQVSAERANLIEELRSASSKLGITHQIIYAKENEEKEITESYENLCEENQQLKLAAIELEAQVQQQMLQLTNMEELLLRTQEQVKCLEDDIRKITDDNKDLERQADIRSCSFAQQSALLDDYHKEKSMLLTQLSASKQTALDLEKRQESVLMEMQGLEAKNHILTGAVEEKMQETEAFTIRYRLEHERARELEQLLACVRSQEHQFQVDNKDKGTMYAMMREQMMREQLLSLGDQVKTLQVTRDAQNQEIMRLQNLLQNKDQIETCNSLSAGYSTLLNEQNATPYLQDGGFSKVKLQELEMKNISLASDLSKTASSYKKCVMRLQKADNKFAEQKKNYDQVLVLLSKVDEERTQLQQKCRELLAEAKVTQPCVTLKDEQLV